MKQYEFRWAHMPSPIGRRPVMLLSRSAASNYLNKLIVAEVTSTIRNIPQEIRVGKSEGLKHLSVVNFDNVHVVARKILGDRLGRLDPSREPEVKRALGHALDWDELKIL